MSEAPGKDLLVWLGARRESLRKRLPGVSALEVGLWEAGVKVDLVVGGVRYGLRFQPRHEGRAWATTRSTSVAVDMGPDATLPRGVEPLLKAVLGVVDQIDDGTLVLQSQPTVCGEVAAPDRDGATEVLPARQLDLVGLACVADTCAMTRAWGLGGAIVARVDGRLEAAGRAAWLEELAEAHPSTVHVDAPRGLADPLTVDFLQGVRAAGVREIVVLLAPDQVGPHDLDALGVTRVVTSASAPAAPGRVRVLTASREALGQVSEDPAALVVRPPEWDAPDVSDAPDLEELAQALHAAVRAGHPREVVGLPLCVAPGVPRRDEPLAALRLARSGTVHTPVCALCTRATACPGLDRAAFQRWGMRGLFPFTEA